MVVGSDNLFPVNSLKFGMTLDIDKWWKVTSPVFSKNVSSFTVSYTNKLVYKHTITLTHKNSNTQGSEFYALNAWVWKFSKKEEEGKNLFSNNNEIWVTILVKNLVKFGPPPAVSITIKHWKNQFNRFHTLFIDYKVSNFISQDQKRGKNKNVENLGCEYIDYMARMVLTKFQDEPCSRWLKNWNGRLFWWLDTAKKHSKNETLSILENDGLRR